MATALSRDLTERLPVEARKKLQEIFYRIEESFAVTRDHISRLEAFRSEIKSKQAELDAVKSNRSEGGGQIASALNDFSAKINQPRAGSSGLVVSVHRTTGLGDRDREQQIEKELSALKADCADFEVQSSEHRSRAQTTGTLYNSIGNWLGSLPLSAEIISQPRAAPNKTQNATPELVEKCRNRVRELLANLRQIDAAPYTSADMKRMVRKEIEQLAEQGRPRVHQLAEQLDAGISWPSRDVNSLSLLGGSVPDGIAFVTWLQRDQVIAAVEKEIDDKAEDDEHALTDEQRAVRLKSCLSDLLRAERAEEELLEIVSPSIIRRPDADPRAVLGLSSALPGPSRGLIHRHLIQVNLTPGEAAPA